MKKCLIVSTVSRQFTLFEKGNIEVLHNLGYEIHCVANYADTTEEIKKLDIIEHHIEIQRSPFSLKNKKAYQQLKKIINSEKYDIIHCHSPMGGVLTRLAAKRTRKVNNTKIIYTAHGFHFFKGAPILNWLLYYPIEKYLSKYTDCLITINTEDYERAKRKFKANQVELVNGIGVEKEKFNFKMQESEKQQLRQSIGLKENDFILIQVGELNKNKNQIMAIETIKKLVKTNPEIHLLLVGRGPLEQFYKQRIKEYNLESNIHMLGYRNDIPQLMKISNILLSLSYREGLPVNVMEAMMCNLPIIATNCRGNRDLITDNNQLVEPNDIISLSNKVIELENKNESVFWECKKFEKENIKAKMKEIYSEVVSKNKVQ